MLLVTCSGSEVRHLTSRPEGNFADQVRLDRPNIYKRVVRLLDD
jgi:hypothetical protein